MTRSPITKLGDPALRERLGVGLERSPDTRSSRRRRRLPCRSRPQSPACATSPHRAACRSRRRRAPALELGELPRARGCTQRGARLPGASWHRRRTRAPRAELGAPSTRSSVGRTLNQNRESIWAATTIVSFAVAGPRNATSAGIASTRSFIPTELAAPITAHRPAHTSRGPGGPVPIEDVAVREVHDPVLPRSVLADILAGAPQKSRLGQRRRILAKRAHGRGPARRSSEANSALTGNRQAAPRAWQ